MTKSPAETKLLKDLESLRTATFPPHKGKFPALKAVQDIAFRLIVVAVEHKTMNEKEANRLKEQVDAWPP